MKLGVYLLVTMVLLTRQLPAQPTITTQPVNQAVVWGGNATFSVMATDVGPLTYQWQLNGTNLPNNIISTVAGGNLFNNLPATNTPLNSPNGVAQDSAGNLFIVDNGGQVIRKVNTNGVATIVAGSGSASFSGDGGAATNAGLNFPCTAIVDSVGNLFIADLVNSRVRKVDTNGVITTVAGNGTAGYSGDNGAATNAEISNFSNLGLCVDAFGNLFIADAQNNRIRKVATNGIITTVVGTGSSGFFGDNGSATSATINNPMGVAVDSSNNLYIADSGNNRIRKVNASGIITTFAGTGTSGYSGDGGAATSAKINNPAGVVVDAAHNLFIVDTGNQCVRKIGTNNIINTVAGNGTNGFSGDGGVATNANLFNPQNVSVDGIGNLFIADSINNRIRKVGTNGIISTMAGWIVNDTNFATNVTFNIAIGIASDSVGNIYIADSYNNRIRELGTNGIVSTVAGNGIASYSGDGGVATNASFRNIWSVTVDSVGNIFIPDRLNNRVRKVDTNGIVSTITGNGTSSFSGDGGAATNATVSAPLAVTCDSVGNLFFVGNSRVRKVDTSGIIATVAGNGSIGYSGDGGAATNAKLFSPFAVSVDSIGNLFIDDQANFRIRKVDTNGIISTVAGNGTAGYSGDGGVATNANLNNLWGVTADSIGNIFIADTSSQRIRKVGTNGIITTVAGNGVQGFAGDGSSGKNASLSSPRGLAMDGAGNLYVMDTGNNRVRKVSYVDYADQPSFTVTNVTPAILSNNYSVIVTSASGSVTSSVAGLNLQLPPITPAFSAANGIYTFTWSAVSNLTYQLQFATNLAAPNWINLGNPVTATNGSASTTDAVGSAAQRFYRVRLLP